MKRAIKESEILSLGDYEAVRAEKKLALRGVKKNRRMALGPYVTFYFESYDTLWLQIQEMLRIEKGGPDQLVDELRAYNPMIPNGRELTATVMFEIEDPGLRQTVLSAVGGVEDTIELRFGGESVKAVPERDLDYTSAEGKASSVQFVHFPFSAAQILKFRAPDQEIILGITHKNYGHMAVMPQNVRTELARDFD